MPKTAIIVDGSVDFSGGVNSYVAPTIATEQNPNGLKRNQLAWMDNATVRGGGITQRPGWKKLGVYPKGATGKYQGKFLYEPDDGYPYIIAVIGGNVWKIDPDNPQNGTNLSATFLTPGIPHYNVSGQVTLTLTNVNDPGFGTVAPYGSTPEIGKYAPFAIPAIGNTVNVAVMTPYGGSLGVTTSIGGKNYTITAINGFTILPSSSNNTCSIPATADRVYFCQAEQFLVIQAGDYSTLPLIWDGTILRASLGLSGGGDSITTPDGYGVVVGKRPSPEIWPVPAILGTKTVDLYSPGLVSVGDYISYVYGQQKNSANILTTFDINVFMWQVTAVGPGTQVTMKLIDSYGNVPAGTNLYNADGFYLCKLYFVSFQPSSGLAYAIGTAEIPPAGPMDYYMGRLWYAQGRKYSAGDIVNGSSGTPAYELRDSVLKITENPLAVGGDGFAVPTNSGNITAIKHSANINTQLGQGQLYIFTRRAVYSLSVPVSRADWIASGNAASGSSNQMPVQTVAQITNGSVNDRSVVAQNGDLFFQSLEPSIRSQTIAVRNFGQWGDTPISVNENRILKFNDRSMMQFSSGISFDNRMLQAVLPANSPVGVVHRAIIPLNFDLISTLDTKLPPAWEGMYEGLNVLELGTANFGGRQRAFMSTYSEAERNIQLWEISDSDRFEGDDNRVQWYAEFPCFTWGDEFLQKKLIGCELWIDRIYGEVDFALDYRPDGDPCWYPWHRWQFCTARNSCEDVHNPVCVYPKELAESFRQTFNMPAPPEACQSVSKRPAYIGFQFQPRLSIKGFCRIRGFILKATRVEQQTYDDIVC